ncbi:MAG TPA: PASTA domain-containing protein [Acidimicrobiales bacterium]|jgi:serine/threonine-protein kinase|nr:PASTA domain-containing protein [Acidimicrobiales bacterium]
MAMGRIADHVGRVLGGRYRLLAPIGTGGSAHVYLAEDSTLRRRVAVKVLHAALADDESFLRRFRAEAQAAAALNHPNVMRVFDWGEAEDGPYLVLEHLGGGSLRDVLDSGQRLTPAQAAHVGVQAARALDYAHRRGLVHRDIKPANLLFDDEGRLCIADFGVARALAEATWTEPEGALVGTARYAAPEQAKGGSVDGRADVYALGLVLIESTTGTVPFMADTTIATLMARVDTPVTAPAELGPLGPVVEAMGLPQAGARPDAAEVARKLESVARSLPDPAPLDLVGPAGAPTPDDLTEVRKGAKPYDRESDGADPTGFAPLGPVPAGRRRRRWLVVLAVVLGLLLSAGIGYGAVQVFTPTHPVPKLTGAALADARRETARLHFKLSVTRRADENIARDKVLSQAPAPGSKLKERKSVAVVVSDGPPPRAVPSLAGLSEADAVAALKAQGFNTNVVQASSETVAKGTVVAWQPQGVQAKGATITVTVSSGPPIVTIPDVAGQSYADAAKALTDAGFTVQRKDDYSDDVPEPGKVISTSPSSGSSAAKGSKVTVTVSKGAKTVTVPDVRGQTIEQASANLKAAGLNVGNVYGPPGARRVIDTLPSAGAQVPRGTAVDLFAKR